MEAKFISLFIVVLFVPYGEASKDNLDSIEQLINRAGFKSEAFQAETDDGYLLKVHRIKVNKASSVPRLGPVFFMHGVIANAADFLLTGPQRALPYLLSNNGYDVWLGNSRGSSYGLKHKTMHVSEDKFWDFSFHEIGFFDVPAMIDLMLNQTNSSRAFFVGHSQGTSSILALLTMRPEYNKKIIQAHLMAPAAFMKSFPRSEVKMLPEDFEINFRGRLIIAGPRTKKIVLEATAAFCGSSSESICEKVLLFICGQNKDEMEMDTSIIPTYLGYISQAVSLKQFAHYFQLIKSGLFRQFDYRENNTKAYGSASPPSYDLKNFKAPTFIYTGGCDMVTSPIDGHLLSRSLPNVKKYKRIENFNHCDFNYGRNSRKILFEDILETLNSEKGSK